MYLNVVLTLGSSELVSLFAVRSASSVKLLSSLNGFLQLIRAMSTEGVQLHEGGQSIEFGYGDLSVCRDSCISHANHPALGCK